MSVKGRNMKGRFIVIIMLSFMVLLGAGNVFAKRYLRIARVQSSTGTVKVWQYKYKRWVKAESQMNFYPHDQIMTGQNASVTIYFLDNSKIMLKSNSMLQVDALVIEKTPDNKIDTKETIFTLWVGKLHALVSRIKEKERFEINTPSALCAVRGTNFTLSVQEDETTLLQVYEGAVGVQDRSGLYEEKMVTAGYQITVEPGIPVPDPEPLVEEVKPSDEAEPEEPEIEKPQAFQPPPAVEEKETVPSKPPAEVPGAPAGGYQIGKWVTITLNGSLGAAVLTDPKTGRNKVYYKVAFLPELAIWKLGVGFDLSLYYDETNTLREEDWDESRDILGKIWYVRFGQKGDPLFAYCGGLPQATIGHGFIMNNYTNMLRYPDEKIVGAQLNVDVGSVGFESMVADINHAEVFGGRIFVRPLYNMKIPIMSRIAIGVSGVTDRDPDSSNKTSDDSVSVFGVDAELPVFSNSYFSSMVYGDAARMELDDTYTLQGSSNHGRGYTAGLMGKLWMFTYRGEYRRFENNFIPSYFNAYYDRDRFEPTNGMGKANTIAGSTHPIIEGPYAELTCTILSLVRFSVSYENYNIDTRSEYPWVHGELTLDPRLLLQKFFVKVSYDKRNANNFDEIKNVRGAIITAEIGYHIAPRVMMVMVQRQTFDSNGKATKKVEIETRIQF